MCIRCIRGKWAAATAQYVDCGNACDKPEQGQNPQSTGYERRGKLVVETHWGAAQPQCQDNDMWTAAQLPLTESSAASTYKRSSSQAVWAQNPISNSRELVSAFHLVLTKRGNFQVRNSPKDFCHVCQLYVARIEITLYYSFLHTWSYSNGLPRKTLKSQNRFAQISRSFSVGILEGAVGILSLPAGAHPEFGTQSERIVWYLRVKHVNARKIIS